MKFWKQRIFALIFSLHLLPQNCKQNVKILYEFDSKITQILSIEILGYDGEKMFYLQMKIKNIDTPIQLIVGYQNRWIL